MTALTRRKIEAVRRVLQLVDDYLALQPQDTLIASESGGVMTWHELREHIHGALKLLAAPRG